jgi:hypothetical protein
MFKETLNVSVSCIKFLFWVFKEYKKHLPCFRFFFSFSQSCSYLANGFCIIREDDDDACGISMAVLLINGSDND